jgi:hypothetical protein
VIQGGRFYQQPNLIWLSGDAPITQNPKSAHAPGACPTSRSATWKTFSVFHPPEISIADLEKILASRPQGAHKFSAILSQEIKQLLAFDRYERRALSRRKFAIRDFDAACRK